MEEGTFTSANGNTVGSTVHGADTSLLSLQLLKPLENSCLSVVILQRIIVLFKSDVCAVYRRLFSLRTDFASEQYKHQLTAPKKKVRK